MEKVNDYKKRNKKIDNKIALVLAILLIIPLIVYKKQVLILSPKIMSNLYGTRIGNEYFNYYKLMGLIILSSLVLILFMYKLIALKYEIKNSNLNKFLVILIFSILISFVLCDFKGIVMMGNSDRFEGVLAWICYTLIFFVTYNIEITKKNLKYFVFILVPFIIINFVLGVLKFYEVNVLNNGMVQILVGVVGGVEGSLWTTLYNPNFISGLSGALFISSTVYIFLEENKKIKAGLLLLSLMMFTTVLTALSLSGFVTIVVLFPIALIFVYRLGDKKELVKWLAILLACCSVIFVFFNKRNSAVWDNSLGFFVKLKSVQNYISIKTVAIAVIALILLIVAYRFLSKKGMIKWLAVLLVCCSLIFVLKYTQTTSAYENNMKSKIETLNELSTGRIHIWQKTIGLIKEKPLFGHGFDTLPYYLDHDDPASNGIIIDKPHNWFLTITYGTGIVGLVGVLGILWCLIKGIFKCWIDKVDDKVIYITGAFIGGFIVQGMVNDTLVGTSIVFWVLAGICANRLILCNAKKEDAEIN